MKIDPTANLQDFILAVGACRSDVLFVTTDGDRLNLKSELSRYLFAAVIKHPAILQKGSLHFHDPEDAELLRKYMVKE